MPTLIVTDATSPTPTGEVLRASALTKSYAGVRALRSGSLDLRAGEVHALIGENGAGKSTLTKIITGAVTADSGELRVFGRVVEANTPNVARSLGIAAIYQQPSIFPDLSVSENIALALEQGTSSHLVDWKARFDRARDLLQSMGSTIDPGRPARTLSMAEQQIVEIAKAIGANARILLMDEPTALLSDHEVGNLFRLIATLRANGVAIVYISHRLEEILSIADRITVLRDGETVAVRSAADVSKAELIQLMVGRSIASIYPKRTVPIGEVALQVRDLAHAPTGLHDVSFEVRRGEILGFAGLVGSGRTELARVLFGLTPADANVVVSGKAVSITGPADALANGIAYLPEDRRQHGLILELPISQNISLASLSRVSRRGLMDHAKEVNLANEYRARLGIKAFSVSIAAGTLSGGNQQKVALARWLATKPDIIILDEPTQGVDVGSKSEIHELIMELAEAGMAVILISSELPEVLGMSDRTAVFHAGTICGVLPREEATQESILALAFGHAEAAA
ncbi:MAG: sugar ABC transporter ATP-binding protein [Janthinobacterium lividum]